MYQLIGAALIIGLLVCFSALAIIWLSKVVTNSIKKKTVDLFSTYDYILAEKARTAKELAIENIKNENVSSLEEKVFEPNNSRRVERDQVTNYHNSFPTQIFNSAYREKGIGDLYSKIRSGFITKPEDALSNIKLVYSDESRIAKDILDEISFDNFYKLTCLDSSKQVSLFREVLSGEQKEFFTDYLNSIDKFSSVKFYDYLNDVKERNCNTAILRVSPSCDTSKVSKDVKIIVDPLILEGFEIEAGNTIYDYGIKAREIC